MNIENIIKTIGINAKKAAHELVNIDSKKKNDSFLALKNAILDSEKDLIEINKKDIDNAINSKLSSAMIDRLTLNHERIFAMANGLDEIIKLKDPVGEIVKEWQRPNKLNFKKITVPIGVIGMIYESRPNVTIDASTIAVKAGNAVILRGGKDSFHSSSKLYELIKLAFSSCGLPENTVQMIPVTDRAAVDCMLNLDTYIDIIIPRGGKGLIKNIKEKSSIPVIKHLDGICHVYVDRDADISIAKKVILNSKMRRPGICGAAETILIDEKIKNLSLNFLEELKNANCEIRGDKFIESLHNEFKNAKEEDWGTEYLDKIISVKIVDGVEGAIEHINQYSSGHTESIITENKNTFKKFYNNIDSAIILQNASTQFADGGEFGFGAEIGISTDKLHVRGPVGSEHLVSFKYVVEGNGQVRP